MSNLLTLDKSTLASGNVSYVEQDGDVGLSELSDGQWEVRMTGAEPKILPSFNQVENYLYEQFPKLEGIVIYK